MNTLGKILLDILIRKRAYVNSDGTVGVDKTDGSVVECHVGAERGVRIPKEVARFIEENGGWNPVIITNTTEVTLWFRRLSDDAELIVRPKYIKVYLRSDMRKDFRVPGFDECDRFFGSEVCGVHISHEKHDELVGFLRAAGVKLKPSPSPWLTPPENDLAVRPSSRRPGKEVYRFLGF